MKALPLWQPWATLVAIGVKRVETRDFSPSRLGLCYGQRIAIHACVTDRNLWICQEEPFSGHIADAKALPRGAVLATCVLARAGQITEESARQLLERNPQEHAFGDYTPGRWAWVLTELEALPEPIWFKGSQGTFDVPDELLGRDPVQGRLL